MATNRCLCIGISDAPPLDYLPGAANAARAIGGWAAGQGYQVELLTDEDEAVGFDEVRAALLRLLPPRSATDRLIVFFAGHGLARDAAEDLWLLSQWFDEQRGLAVGGLRRRLETFAIRQLVMIGDACRSAATGADNADLVADPVLGRGHADRAMPTADVLRAASAFRAAYMIPGGAAGEDRCIFSGVLEEALSGAHEAAFEDDRITNFGLADFLATEVPKRAATYGVDLKPDIVTGLRPPANLYRVGRAVPPPVPKAWPPASAPGAMGVAGGAAGDAVRGWSTKREAATPVPAEPPDGPWAIPEAAEPIERTRDFGANDWAADETAEAAPEAEGDGDGGGGGAWGAPPPAFPPPSASPAPSPASAPFGGSPWAASPPPPAPASPPLAISRSVEIDAAVARRAAAAMVERTREFTASYERGGGAPTHFETGSGFAVTGATVRRAWLGGGATAEDERDGTWWRVLPGPAADPRDGQLGRPLPLLVELDGGRWIGAAVMPQFVTGITVRRSGAESVILRRFMAPSTAEEAAVAELRAGALAQGSPRDRAALLRDAKEQDPTRAVLAAYLYDSVGDVESIHRTCWWLAQSSLGGARIGIPFDLALLGGIEVERDGGMLVAHIPATGDRKPSSPIEAARAFTHQATAATTAPVAGEFPWMRQGWSLIDPDDASPLIRPRLGTIAPALRPSPYTTLSAEGGAALLRLMEG